MYMFDSDFFLQEDILQSTFLHQFDDVSFSLKAPHDFSFLAAYGRVFKVFDEQDSGNICFGVENAAGERRFIKYAGAHTLRMYISQDDAVRNLKNALPLYETLRHESLIPFLGTLETENGFGLVFQWTDGQCMGRMYPESHARFMALSIDEKLEVFRNIQSFLDSVHRMGYLAVDFYDGSILYDFARKQTLVCDMDYFMKKPCINHMGRMWGSSTFMSPEEFEKGAVMDEITNVYTLGAFAFALFGGYYRDREHWQLCDAAFAAARHAVSPQRAERPQSIAAFAEDWEKAVRG